MDMTKSVYNRYRIPILLSIAFHVALVIVLLLWYRSDNPIAAQQKPQETDDAASIAQQSLPPKITEDIVVPPAQIQSSVQSKIAQVGTVSNEIKRKQLDKELGRLQRVSDQESVDQVADAVAKSMGIDQSQYADKPVSTDGDFDHNTAQIKTVTRNKDEAGDWQYVATMIDAQGHQLETPLSESEGASVYETFEKMKQYPMAESLYQKIIMPIMQKMIESESGR